MKTSHQAKPSQSPATGVLEVWHDSLQRELAASDGGARRALDRSLTSQSAEAIARDAALQECCVRLAEHFYTLALSYFAAAEKRRREVYVRTEVRPPKEIYTDLARLGGIARCFIGDNQDLDGLLRLAGDPVLRGTLRNRSRRWCEAAVAVSEGSHFPAMELLAAHLLLDRRVAAALVVYNRIAATTPSPRLRGFSLSNAAKALLELNRPKAALRACEEALSLLPDDCVALANLATASLMVMDVERALTSYRKIAHIRGTDPLIAPKLGQLLTSDLRWVERNEIVSQAQAKKIRKELQVLELIDR